MPATITLHLEPGRSYAPGYVIVTIVSKRIRRLVAEHVASRGGIPDVDKDAGTEIIHSEEVAHVYNLTPAQMRDIDEGWGVSIKRDVWDALAPFGYDTADTLADTIRNLK